MVCTAAGQLLVKQTTAINEYYCDEVLHLGCSSQVSLLVGTDLKPDK